MRLVILVPLFLVGCSNDGAAMPATPSRCEPREPVECAIDVGEQAPLRRAGSTTGADDQYRGASCGLGGDAIEDQAFRWAAPRADRYSISTEGSSFDTVLIVRRGSCAGREMACNDNAEPGLAHSRVSIQLAECDVVTFVVDGHDVEAVGAFVLSIHGTESVCDNGLDDDGDSTVDCDDHDCFSRTCSRNGSWSEIWADLEWQILDAINRARSEGATCGDSAMPPAQPLAMEESLRLAARLHSDDMAAQDYFAHESLDGRTVADRVAAAGFTSPGPIGENILEGTSNPADAVASWLTSPGHCMNLMDPTFRTTGIGFAEHAGQTRWTQDFAR